MGKYALELNGVTKQYKDFKLDSISFTVPQGSIVGLIGENGAGKSTTINAILGLIVTEQGKISVFNGKDVSAETKEHIGVVFDGSNYPDNLTPKKLGKVFQNIYAEWNNKKYFELLNKFELPINKKLKEFSKGMNMKYSIAVALSHNSKLLILDEATSALDNESEKIVQDSLEKLAKGRTVFTIAHRLTTISNANMILVLTENGIQEQGTHQELIDKKGLYYNLYSMYTSL